MFVSWLVTEFKASSAAATPPPPFLPLFCCVCPGRRRSLSLCANSTSSFHSLSVSAIAGPSVPASRSVLLYNPNSCLIVTFACTFPPSTYISSCAGSARGQVDSGR